MPQEEGGGQGEPGLLSICRRANSICLRTLVLHRVERLNIKVQAGRENCFEGPLMLEFCIFFTSNVHSKASVEGKTPLLGPQCTSAKDLSKPSSGYPCFSATSSGSAGILLLGAHPTRQRAQSPLRVTLQTYPSLPSITSPYWGCCSQFLPSNPLHPMVHSSHCTFLVRDSRDHGLMGHDAVQTGRWLMPFR
jgi:hypothetical protein